MKRWFTHFLLFGLAVAFCSACQWKLKFSPDEEEQQKAIAVQRYDRIESLYLTTGDFSALQQMETEYPMETRTLIENVLKLGAVDDHEINNRLLAFFQNTTLQTLISDAEAQYANMDDINAQLNVVFRRMQQAVPGLPVPLIYAQITSLDQSIVVGDGTVGISLDKYLGQDYDIYKHYYNEEQRASMTRQHIVPDCLIFYLISLYPVKDFETRTQEERDLHMGKMMWVSNYALGKPFFKSSYVDKIGKFMAAHPKYSVEQLLKTNDYADISH